MNDNQKKPELDFEDTSFVRVLEDLIEVLIANGTIRLTDLPPEALAKLKQRKKKREQLQDTLKLINEGDEDLLI